MQRTVWVSCSTQMTTRTPQRGHYAGCREGARPEQSNLAPKCILFFTSCCRLQCSKRCQPLPDRQGAESPTYTDAAWQKNHSQERSSIQSSRARGRGLCTQQTPCALLIKTDSGNRTQQYRRERPCLHLEKAPQQRCACSPFKNRPPCPARC
jgi:hypothetical protein